MQIAAKMLVVAETKRPPNGVQQQVGDDKENCDEGEEKEEEPGPKIRGKVLCDVQAYPLVCVQPPRSFASIDLALTAANLRVNTRMDTCRGTCVMPSLHQTVEQSAA